MKKLKGKEINEKRLEIVVAVLLCVTALLTAWTHWMGGVHANNRAAAYAECNRLQAEGNAEYNQSVQMITKDMILWNDITEQEVKYFYNSEDKKEKELAAYQIYFLCNQNLTTTMAEKIGWDAEEALTTDDPIAYVEKWLDNEKSQVTPFADQEYVESYYKSAQEKIEQAEELLQLGNEDNENEDRNGFVAVIFSIVLFIFGIAGTFKNLASKKLLVIIGAIILVIGVIYMCNLPLPRNFSLANYFVQSE